MGVYPVDRVVAVPGKVVAKTANLVVQPLDTSIIRQINVREGQLVHAGDLLARLDPTFAQADAGSLDARVASLQAEVDRLEAETNDRAYSPDGSPASQLQALIFAQRHAERTARLENYRQKIDSAQSQIARTTSDIVSYAEELRAAQAKEGIRKQLEKLQLGSKLNTLDAGAQRADVNRSLQAAFAANAAAKSDLEALMSERDGYVQQTRSETSEQLTEQGRKLADAKDQQAKAALRSKLVDLRADRDAIVLNVAKVSAGSVVQSGDELITLVPADAAAGGRGQHPGPRRRLRLSRQPRRDQVRHLPVHHLRLRHRHADHCQRRQLLQPARQAGPPGGIAGRMHPTEPPSSAATCRWTR